VLHSVLKNSVNVFVYWIYNDGHWVVAILVSYM